MIKYEQPQFTVLMIKSNDVVTTSNFEINNNDAENNATYTITPDVIFGF